MERWLKRAPGRAAAPSFDALPDELLQAVFQLVPEVTYRMLGSSVYLRNTRWVPIEGAAAAAAATNAPPLHQQSCFLVPPQRASGARVPPLAPARAAAAGQPVRIFLQCGQNRSTSGGVCCGCRAAAATPAVPAHYRTAHHRMHINAGARGSWPPGAPAVPRAAQVGAGWCSPLDMCIVSVDCELLVHPLLSSGAPGD